MGLNSICLCIILVRVLARSPVQNTEQSPIPGGQPYRGRNVAWDGRSRAIRRPKGCRPSRKFRNRSEILSPPDISPILYNKHPLLDRPPSYCRSNRGGRWVYRPNGLFSPTRQSQKLFLRCSTSSISSQHSGWHFLSFREIAVMSSSPEADKLEQSLLDGCAHAEYVGRRPSSSGRDTKRFSACYLQSYLYPSMPLRRVSPSLGGLP
jgi:hypothetical protein